MMKQLRQHLADTGMTQAAFAKRVGVNQATIAKLCGDRPHISAELAVRIERETAGAVPVESWPSFEPLLHRTPLKTVGARAGLLPGAEKDSVDIPIPASEEYPTATGSAPGGGG